MEKQSMIVCGMKGEFGFARLESKRSGAVFFHIADGIDTPDVLLERWNLLAEGAPIFAGVKTQEGGRLRAEAIELYSLEEIQETDPYYQPPNEPNVSSFQKPSEPQKSRKPQETQKTVRRNAKWWMHPNEVTR
jgi:hypothetical protein